MHEGAHMDGASSEEERLEGEEVAEEYDENINVGVSAPSKRYGRVQMPSAGSKRVVFKGVPSEDASSKQEADITAADPLEDTIKPGCCVRLLDERTHTHRYVIHFLLCWFLPGPYFMDAQFGAYEKEVCLDVLLIDAKAFEWLVALPCLTGALCGPLGSLIARLGDTMSSLAAGTVVLAAAVLVVVGLDVKDFWAVLVGRTFFWLGIYMLYAVQTIVMYQLFHGQALTIAVGAALSLMRVGGVLGFALAGILKETTNDAVKALKIAIGLVGLAFLATSVFASLRSESVKACWAPVLRGNVPRLAQAHNRIPSIGQLRRFRKATWLLLAQIGLLYAVTFPFEMVATEYFEEVWYGDRDDASIPAGQTTAIAPLFGVIAWVFGFFIKTLPSMLRMSVLAWTSYIAAFFFFYLKYPSNPRMAMCLFGLAYAYLATAIWALLPRTLGQDQGLRAVAVSLAYSCLAVLMFASNLFVGKLQEDMGFNAVLLWFMLLSFTGLACSFSLWRLAAQEKYMWFSSDEQQHAEEEEEEEDRMEAPQADGQVSTGEASTAPEVPADIEGQKAVVDSTASQQGLGVPSSEHEALTSKSDASVAQKTK